MFEDNSSDVCFMIQPFDGGRFDKLFEDVFEPAIKAAGFKPYRVDRDPGVSIPIDEIESNISRSTICFAEISVDNPNVWYELGYAIAQRKDVILVSASGRPKYPFDIQHRSIISYQSESPRDFKELAEKIETRAKAIIKRRARQENVITSTVKLEKSGLKPHEMHCLGTIGAQTDGLEGSAPLHVVRREMQRAGYNQLAVTLALRSLSKLGYIDLRIMQEWSSNETYESYALTNDGWNWIDNNIESLELTEAAIYSTDEDESIPF